MSINKKTKGINVAINGFGRIGRSAFKALLDKKNSNFNIIAINDLTDTKTLAHLLKYDSVYGNYGRKVEFSKDSLTVNGKKYKVFAYRDPQILPWKALSIDIVLECTGFFRTKEDAFKHIKAGAKKVILSAPGKGGGVKTIVLGVNENKLSKSDKIVSMASCTTNCLAPITEVVRQNFGIAKAIMTTIHSYTTDQNIVDGPHQDLRRARAAATNIVPTTTGAAIATAETIPSLKGKFDGMAVRVPVLVGSITDAVYITKKNTNESKVNQVFKKASRSAQFKNYISVTEEPIVSSDIIGNPSSAIVDLALTKVIGGNLVKVVAWYDNEWGYSNRLADLVEYIWKKRLI
ncbi:type I glyceraldehyde-3-phosphate dehydrogenase [Candidatus Falkowbacteria bacterium CG02_land_8_20_14_3_00_36_14]|uniref:Glyceraldehyde-3-phosphate dehydrogenase n=1 Tax=Candidatus Falkowbacteria bacterium CG02_land_8_20_14_3_00_36_14 TaxID=1974560 RepID=A0A2M7DPS5_9BACT|nr:MAG: type I glyceraldehyde-3-phosphate dehydrogenase [Candidatus Falkowbacteria bacterium CG02_land_8_20_14_3_00_36_14]